MAALKIEERESRLLGLDAALRFTDGGQPVPNADQMAQLIQRHLNVEQQRTLVLLLRLARDGPDDDAVETTADQSYSPGNFDQAERKVPPQGNFDLTPTETARAMVVPPSVLVHGQVTEPPADPAPVRYDSVEAFARGENQHLEDPLVATFYDQHLTRWAKWHNRNCDGDPKRCRHFD
jgi:hypothetical protein